MYTFYLRTQKESRAESNSFDRVRWEKIVKVFFWSQEENKIYTNYYSTRKEIEGGRHFGDYCSWFLNKPCINFIAYYNSYYWCVIIIMHFGLNAQSIQFDTFTRTTIP